MVGVGVGVIVVVVVVVPDNPNNHTALLLIGNCKSLKGVLSKKSFFEASFYYIFMPSFKMKTSYPNE